MSAETEMMRGISTMNRTRARTRVMAAVETLMKTARTAEEAVVGGRGGGGGKNIEEEGDGLGMGGGLDHDRGGGG